VRHTSTKAVQAIEARPRAQAASATQLLASLGEPRASRDLHPLPGIEEPCTLRTKPPILAYERHSVPQLLGGSPDILDHPGQDELLEQVAGGRYKLRSLGLGPAKRCGRAGLTRRRRPYGVWFELPCQAKNQLAVERIILEEDILSEAPHKIGLRPMIHPD
jgi:hypothetical protein